MRKHKVFSAGFIILLGVVLPLSGCGMFGEPTPEEEGEGSPKADVGTVSGVVTESGVGSAIEGVTVSIGNQAFISKSDGGYIIKDIPIGEQNITASKEGYEDYSEKIDVKAGDNTHNIELTPTGEGQEGEQEGSISGLVTLEGEESYDGVTVSLEGTPFSVQTDSAGAYMIDEVPVGT